MRASQNDVGTTKAFLSRGVTACTALSVATGSAASAQNKAPTTPLRIELNRIEAIGESCRAYFLTDNQEGEGWRSLKLDLFVLDMDGISVKRLAVEAGPLPEKKTLIKLFDFPSLDCPRFGRILLNDGMACERAADSREACLRAIETASVATVPFPK
jgi:hypothetical protein